MRQFPDDPGCSAMAGKLYAELDALADRADATGGSAPSSSKPLILK